MKRCYHIPARLQWRTEPTAEENARLHRVITAAIRRAAESLAGEPAEIVVSDFEAQGPTRERFLMGRYRPDRDIYTLPGYQDRGEWTVAPVEEITFEETPVITGVRDQVIEERPPFQGARGHYQPDHDTYAVHGYQDRGEPTEAPVEEIAFEETPVIAGVHDQVIEERPPFQGARGRYQPDRDTYALPGYQDRGESTVAPVEEITFEETPVITGVRDQVIEERPPFQGALVATLPGNRYVYVASRRYAISGNVANAYDWGRALFGATAWVIAARGDRQGNIEYYVAALDEALTEANLRVQPTDPSQIPGTAGIFAGRVLGRLPGDYQVIAVGVRGGSFTAPSAEALADFQRQFREARPMGTESLPKELVRASVFGPIDELLARGGPDDLERAAKLLAELNVTAYAAMDWETKSRYLQTLIRAWTWEPQEVAVVEILKSMDGRSELFAALSLVKQAGLYDQLFADLDSQIWSLLITVGERFGDPEPITFAFLVDLLQQAGLVPRTLEEVAAKIVLGPAGPVLSPNFLAELEEAARGFVHFLGGALVGIGEVKAILSGVELTERLAAAVTRERFTSGALPRSVVLQQPLNADETAFVDDLLARVERGSGTFEAAETVARKRGISLSLRLTEDDLKDPELDAYVSQFGSSSDLAALPLIGQIRQREDALLQAIAQEFARFGAHVQDAFQATAKLNGVRSALESYRFIRALLYRDGWIDASRVFQDILPPDQGARFLGTEIYGGAHRLLIRQLGDLTKHPGEDPATGSGEVSLPVKTIRGFQPRRIAGKDALSNHVFGLAIDIDATWNPHLKNEAARIVTRHSGLDFTQRLIQQGVAIDDLYRKLSQASQRFSKWLQESLKLEARLREDLRKAQDKRAAARTEQEKKEAESEVNKAQTALANNMGMLLELDILRQEFGENAVAEWEKHGILTIPVALVRALKNQAFGWGAEWEGSKDLMHFELDPLMYIPSLRVKARKP